MKKKLHIQFSPTRLKQMKKIALSGSRAKLKILNGKLEEGFQILKSTAQKFKSFATDLSDRIPQALAARISLDLFAHFESKSSKRLRIPKGIVLGGVLALMASMPAVGQTIYDVTTTVDGGAGSLRQAILNANADLTSSTILLDDGLLYTLAGSSLPIVGNDFPLQIICTGSANARIDGAGAFRPLTMAANSNLTISNITVQNGSATHGGGIYNTNGALTIANSLITNNEATTSHGGGIYSTGTASVLIQNSTISLNSATSRGSAIYIRNGNSPLTISSSTISENTAPFEAIRTASPITITCSSIIGNTASTSGGGLYARLTTAFISNSSVSNNTGGDGAGLKFRGAATIVSSTISGNISATRGGGIYNGNSPLTITCSSITGNRANGSYGGGIQNRNVNNDVTISNTLISGNFSLAGGAGINSDANLRISGSTISGNTSNQHGGAIYQGRNAGGNLSISSSTISGNTANNKGGGIYNKNTNMDITASSITTNVATLNQGGGLYLKENGTDVLTIVNTTISSNEASADTGGGIYNASAGAGNTLTLQQVTISNNSGTVTGGFANTGVPTISLQNSIIANSIGLDFAQGGATFGVLTGSIVEDGSFVSAGNVFNVDPLLGTLALNSGFLVHSLQTGSPAIDAGANIGITTDQVGNTRDTSPHIGAVEITTASLVCMVVTAPAGITNTWIGCTNSDWNTATNWSTGVVPTASDVVYIPTMAANQLVIDEVATCAKMVVQIGARCLINYNAGGKLLIKF